jgi:hypothetical protein
MEHHQNPGKAAGNSDHRRQHCKDAVSASRSHHTYERPPVSSQNFESDQRHSFTSRSSEQPQALNRRMSQHHDTRPRNSELSQEGLPNSTQDHQVRDNPRPSIDDWDSLEHEDKERDQENVPTHSSFTSSHSSLTLPHSPLRSPHLHLSPEPGPPRYTTLPQLYLP